MKSETGSGSDRAIIRKFGTSPSLTRSLPLPVPTIRKRPSVNTGPHFVVGSSFRLPETTQGFSFRFINIKHRQQFGNHQQILNLVGEAEQLELAAGAANGRIVRNQLANAARIDVANAGEIQQDLLVSGRNQLANCAA